jgi:hypothetical protein
MKIAKPFLIKDELQNACYWGLMNKSFLKWKESVIRMSSSFHSVLVTTLDFRKRVAIEDH